MPDLFYLQDSRSNVGSRAMFWRDGGGYTSNLDEAEQFTREQAVKQYECRETDLPWPVEYVCARAQVGVDHQYLEQGNATYSAPFYVSMPREWDGNDLYWKRPLDTGGLTSNLLDAGVWESESAELLAYQGYQVWPKAYIDGKSRRVVPAALLHHKQALRSVGLKLAMAKPQKARRYRYRCEPCGRFLTEYQNYTECPNCGAENRP